MTPHFEYKPVKVSFKKKLRLRDLTPEKVDNELTWTMLGIIMLWIGSCVGIIYFLKWVNEIIERLS